MAKISALTALTSPAAGDKIPIVDVSDTTQASTGTTKAITKAYLDSRIVYANTVSYVITEANNNTIYTNENDIDGCDFTLPTAATGLIYSVYIQAANTITIKAASGDTIRIGSSVTGDAGAITCTAVGSSVTLVAINATEWVSLAHEGTWSF